MSDPENLAAQVGAALLEFKWQLATAESCTGGGIAQAITDIAGSSQWFDRGFVTYSNASKTALLGVGDALLLQHGAVSAEVAEAMARGALSNSQARIAVSTTGIAGPGGAVPGKPVGTVFFCWAAYHSEDERNIGSGGESSSDHVAASTEKLIFTGNRQDIREQAVRHALTGILRHLRTLRAN